jgi:hypothetical protein
MDQNQVKNVERNEREQREEIGMKKMQQLPKESHEAEGSDYRKPIIAFVAAKWEPRYLSNLSESKSNRQAPHALHCTAYCPLSVSYIGYVLT